MRFVFFICLILAITGCSVKEKIVVSKAYYILIKTPRIKIADTGFLTQSETSTKLQIFNATTPLLNLHVTQSQICLEATCMQKSRFYEEFFAGVHYDDFLDDILHLAPLYDGKNLVQLADGFEQKIVLEKSDIYYKIENKNLIFKDIKNDILILFKEL
ncbi:MAG: hypothetical protein IBX44_04935 [Sulfurospirillum sp.]|nr:hypothetical protein [Sulfurospirillum sp.]